MDEDTLALLGRAAAFDVEAAGAQSHCFRGRREEDWVSYAIGYRGQRVPLLKVLQTSRCQKNCNYCSQRVGRDVARGTMGPDELAHAYDRMERRRVVQGLFLSSGIWGNANRCMERMVATVELLRKRYQFRGYVHMKILPGAQDAAIRSALQLADRVSLNLEAPNSRRIAALSSSKDFQRELLQPLLRAHRLRQSVGRSVTLATQFVVGASDETDRELINSVGWLYRHINLHRAYYSAFRPIRNTPLENHRATPAWREHRLYQADFLLRDYGFQADEMVFGEDGLLPRESDPKLAWALAHPERFPIEVNLASRRELLRIPGLGPTTADRIVERRQGGRLREMGHLGMSQALARRAAPYVLLDGHRPSYQMPLWSARMA